MSLAVCEWRKLFRLPALWAFLALCLAFNGLLILDEPTAGLDPRERVRFRNLIHALSGERIVILSTHIVSDIETIAGQIVMFKGHRLY